MTIRGPTNKFFYDVEHDVVLYALMLENYYWNDDSDDFFYTRSGDIRCNWRKVSDIMTKIFERKFSECSVRARFSVFVQYEFYLSG